MIDPKSFKIEPFLRKLALHVTGEAKAAYVADEDVWYLGAGYWRARVTESEEGRQVHLINPSRKAEEIAAVEAAMSILI